MWKFLFKKGTNPGKLEEKLTLVEFRKETPFNNMMLHLDSIKISTTAGMVTGAGAGGSTPGNKGSAGKDNNDMSNKRKLDEPCTFCGKMGHTAFKDDGLPECYSKYPEFRRHKNEVIEID